MKTICHGTIALDALRYAPCVTTTSMFVKIVGATSAVIVFTTIRTEESAAGLFKVTHELDPRQTWQGRRSERSVPAIMVLREPRGSGRA